MKFQIDFHYPITFVPFRLRNTERRFGLGQTELEIAEISSGDAPVAMRIAGGSKSGERGRYARKTDGSLRDIRHRNGRFYIETTSAEQFAQEMADPQTFSENTFFRVCSPIQKHSLPSADPQGKNALTTIDRIRSSQKWGQPIQDDKTIVGLETMEAELKFVASEMFIVDGTLFELCPEPIVSMTSSAKGQVECVVASRPIYAIGSMKLSGNLAYAIHDIAGGYSISEISGASLKDVDDLIKTVPDVVLPEFELLIPEASIFDGATYDVMRETEAVVKSWSGKVASMGREELEAFFELRDANASAVRSMNQVTPRLVEALKAFSRLEMVEPTQRQTDALSAYAVVAQKSFGGRSYTYKQNNSIASPRAGTEVSPQAHKAGAIVSRWEARNREHLHEDSLHWNGGIVSAGVRTFNVYSEDAAAALAGSAKADRAALLERFRAGDMIVGIRGDSDFHDQYAFAVITPGSEWSITDNNGLAAEAGVDLIDMLELHVVDRPFIDNEWQPALSAKL